MPKIISLAEACRIALDILRRAEQQREEYAKREAERIAWMMHD